MSGNIVSNDSPLYQRAPATSAWIPHQSARQSGQRGTLRLLSYNIQTGIASQRYRHYVTRGLRHIMPHAQVVRNLDKISSLVGGYDVVALQEVDAGSLRTGFINQTEYLAHRAAFPYWYSQTNRRMGHLAQVSIGLLSQLKPRKVTEHRLPGPPGRGLMVVQLGNDQQHLYLFILHLSLGSRARRRQLSYVGERIRDCKHVIVMGDFNAALDSPEMRTLIAGTQLHTPRARINTFPSWRPQRGLDHILVSEDLEVLNIRVMDRRCSDHLPLCTEVRLPEGMRL